MERVNPTLVPTVLDVGTMVTFPVFCQCPAAADNVSALVTYVMQPGDTYVSVADDPTARIMTEHQELRSSACSAYGSVPAALPVHLPREKTRSGGRLCMH